MKEGAFALVDCLGFKGIWRNANPEDVLTKLKHIESVVSSDDFNSSPAFSKHPKGPISAHIKLLSDTVAISLQYAEDEQELGDYDKGYLVALTSIIVIRIINIYLNGTPIFALRGCISFGKHMADGNFIIGPAVDQAAEHMDTAEGALVWLLPSALKIYYHFHDDLAATAQNVPSEALVPALSERTMADAQGGEDASESDRDIDTVAAIFRKRLHIAASIPIIIDNYSIPLKGGRYLTSGVVNPLALSPDVRKRTDIISKYQDTLEGDRLDIWIKQQNTLNFLGHANAECNTFYTSSLWLSK